MEKKPERTVSQEHDTDSINDLLESTQLQSDNIDRLVDGLKLLSNQMKQRPTKGGVWKIVSAVGGAIIALILVLNVLNYNSSHESLKEIKSCTTPDGECARRGQDAQVGAIAQIICNQEKVLYFQYYQYGYVPQEYCIQFVNMEIDRLKDDIPQFQPPKLPVPEGVTQYGIGVENTGE